MNIDRESVEWLNCLVGSYRELLHELAGLGCPDEDPAATLEMLSAVERLSVQLEAAVIDEPEQQQVATEANNSDIPF